MRQLAIAKDLSLPIDVVTQKAAFMGRTGSGKTYGATKLAELMLDAGAQVVAIDPVGVWYGLRLDKDGKDPSGIEIPVFGGLHGDIPLEPTAGALIADLVVDRALSAILDVSQWERDSDKARFASDFAARFFFRKKASPSAVHLFIEECQEFVPQNPGRGEEQMLHAFHRLIKLGRNFGIGVSLISQRPQEVNKKALNQTELLLAFQMTGPQERKAISAWVSEKGADEDVADILPRLAVGEPHVWSPQWLQISRTIKIAAKETFNASSTPTFGAKAVEAKPLGSIDLEKLQKAMASTIEKAKADDPKHLKSEILRLKRELEAKPKTNGHGTVKEKLVVDQAVVERAVKSALVAERKRWQPSMLRIERELTGAFRASQKLTESLQATLAPLSDAIHSEPDYATHSVASVAARPQTAERSNERVASTGGGIARRATPEPRQSPSATYTGEGVSRGQQRILDALAQLKAFGVSPATRAATGIMAGYELTGGTGSKHIAAMVAEGLVVINQPGTLELTTAGDKLAAAPPDTFSLEELHQAALSRLSPGEARILEYLFSVYPEAQSRADVGAAVSYELTGGTGSKHIAKLTTLGFVDIPQPGQLRAGELLYPEALVSL